MIDNAVLAEISAVAAFLLVGVIVVATFVLLVIACHDATHKLETWRRDRAAAARLPRARVIRRAS